MADEISGMPPVPGEKPKGHMSTTWAIVIIVVAALLIGGGIWYWYSKTVVKDTNVTIPEKTASTSASASPSTSGTDETAGWQTYTDTTNNFSFKYPPQWTKQASGNIDKSIVTIVSNNEYPPKEEPIQYFLDVTKETGKPQDYTTSTVNNFTVYITKNEPSRSGLIKYYFKKSNNEYIALGFTPYDEQSPLEGQSTEYPYFQKILTTFKFL